MKKILSIALALTLAVSALSAQTTAAWTAIDTQLTTFLNSLNKSAPDNAVSTGTWSDAYIGQIISVPPHFGIGASAGLVPLDVTNLAGPIGTISGMTLPITSFVLPTYAIEGRIGGFILPFDLGVHVGVIPSTDLFGTGIRLDFLNYGADVRYALLKENILLPNLSVGAGYYHVAGSLGYTFNMDAAQNLVDSYGLNATIADIPLKVGFTSEVIEARVQLSKSLLIATPFVGVAANLSFSDATYTLADQTKTVSTASSPVLGARVYGGASVNVLVLKINLTGSYNLINQNWGANLGVRVQL